jgi:hypothetical protein
MSCSARPRRARALEWPPQLRRRQREDTRWSRPLPLNLRPPGPRSRLGWFPVSVLAEGGPPWRVLSGRSMPRFSATPTTWCSSPVLGTIHIQCFARSPLWLEILVWTFTSVNRSWREHLAADPPVEYHVRILRAVRRSRTAAVYDQLVQHAVIHRCSALNRDRRAHGAPSEPRRRSCGRLTSLAASTLLMLVARAACHWTQSPITKSQNDQGRSRFVSRQGPRTRVQDSSR